MKRPATLYMDTAVSSNWMLRITDNDTITTITTSIPYCNAINATDIDQLCHEYDCELMISVQSPGDFRLQAVAQSWCAPDAAEPKRYFEPMTWSQQVHAWRNATFGQSTLDRSYDRAIEELDELHVEMGMDPNDLNIRDAKFFDTDIPYEEKERIADEAADYSIALASFIGDLGCDLAERIANKHRINSTEREWHSNGDGTGYHIKKDK